VATAGHWQRTGIRSKVRNQPNVKQPVGQNSMNAASTMPYQADSPPPDPSFSAERGEEFCHIDDFERLIGVAEDNSASQDDKLVKT